MKSIKRIITITICVILIVVGMSFFQHIKNNEVTKKLDGNLNNNVVIKNTEKEEEQKDTNNQTEEKNSVTNSTGTSSTSNNDKERDEQSSITSNLINNQVNSTKPTNNDSNNTAINEDNIKNESIEVTDFEVYLASTTIKVGEVTKVKLVIKPSSATNPSIKIATDNYNIATVASDLTITGKSKGSCNIYIIVNNIRKRFVLNVIEQIKDSNDTSTIIVTPATNPNQPMQEEKQPTNIKEESTKEEPVKDTSKEELSKQEESKIKKNGWYTINNKKYYYKDDKILTNQYVDYLYLDKFGVAQEKIGDFDATLYGAKAWANQDLNIREQATKNSKKLGTVPRGSSIKILSAEDKQTKYIKMSYNDITGYVYSDYIYINLPDIMPDIIYEITNADNSIFKTADMSIPNVTNTSLYGFTKQKNEKIGKETYYAPLLYPVAKQLQTANRKAVSEGYNFKIYDTYRPYDVSQKINKEFKQLYNSNSIVKKQVNYDKNGNYWGTGWFLANGVSGHNRGTDIDMALTDKDGNELKAQTPMHTLDSRSVVNYNNDVSNKLRQIMTSSGFETLKSEWWHFQENSYRGSEANSFRLK